MNSLVYLIFPTRKNYVFINFSSKDLRWRWYIRRYERVKLIFRSSKLTNARIKREWRKTKKNVVNLMKEDPVVRGTRVRTNHGGSKRVVHYDLMLTLVMSSERLLHINNSRVRTPNPEDSRESGWTRVEKVVRRRKRSTRRWGRGDAGGGR